MNIIAGRGRSMSPRARGYLIVASGHFTLVGLSVLLSPEMYQGTSFIPIITYTSLIPWGSAYLITGMLCALAAILKWPSFARAGLISAFVVLFVSAFAIGWGVIRSWLDIDPTNWASPLVPLSLMALALKDLLMVGRPLRTPVEDYWLAQARIAAHARMLGAHREPR
jgi:hypothetical protein